MSKVIKKFNKAYADQTGIRSISPSPSSKGPRPLTSPADLKNVNKATDIYEPWMEPTWHGPEMKPQPTMTVTEPDSPPPDQPEKKSRSRFKYSTDYSDHIPDDELNKAEKMRQAKIASQKAAGNKPVPKLNSSPVSGLSSAPVSKLDSALDLNSNYQNYQQPAKKTTTIVSSNPKNKIKYSSAVRLEPREDANKEYLEFDEHESNAIGLSRNAKPVIGGNPRNKTVSRAASMDRKYDPEPDFGDDETTTMRSFTPPPKRSPIVGNPKNRLKARASSMDTRYDSDLDFQSPTPPLTPSPPPKPKSTLMANPRNKPARTGRAMDSQEDSIIEPPLTPPYTPPPPAPRPLNKPRNIMLAKSTDTLEGKEEPDVPQRKKAKQKRRASNQRPPTMARPSPLEEAREIPTTKARAPQPPPLPSNKRPPLRQAAPSPTKKPPPESDSDESDYGPYHKWVMNGRDDDILPNHARRLLFENKVKKKQ